MRADTFSYDWHAAELPAFESHRLLVVGDVILDRYWHGATSRISPEAPVPVVRVCNDEVRPGGAGNVALNIAALGAQATLLALVGADEAAAQLEQCLAAGGVSFRLVPCAGNRTVTKLRVMSQHQQMIRLDFENGFSALESASLLPPVRSALEDADVVVISDYAKGALLNVAEIIRLARHSGKTVIVDPKGRDFERYRGATILKPNLAEFEAIVGPCPDETSLVARAEKLRDTLDLHALVITRSEHGMSIFEHGCAPVHLSTDAHEVCDVTGAGDTVTAALACALAAGMPLVAAAGLANRAAAIVVGKSGTATASREELLASLPKPACKTGCGQVALNMLPECLADARALGETVLGLAAPESVPDARFFLMLEQARQLGNRVLVLVPLTTPDKTHDLLALYSAFRGVDWVAAAPRGEVQKRLAALASAGQIVTATTQTDALTVLAANFHRPPSERLQALRSTG